VGDLQDEIRELNLAYLILAQKMLREDHDAAMLRLGLDDEAAELIAGLSSARLVHMASSQMLLPVFRCADGQLAGLLAGEGRDPTSSSIHAAIVAASRLNIEGR